MYKTVLSIVKQHETIWGGTPGVVNSVNRLENSLISLNEKESAQGSVTLGVSMAREMFFENVADKMIILHDALWIYAKSTNQFELQARNHHSPSKVRNLGSSKRLIQINTLLIDLTNHGTELAFFGVTPATIENFVSLVSEYQLIALNPRMSIVSRKTITEEITRDLFEINEILQILDRLIRSFNEQESNFVLLYFNARIKVDLKGKRNLRSGAPPVEPDDGTIIE